MPHKRNPVLSENLTGIARIIRASIIPSLENITLWHERDISHSSVERINCPDILTLTDFALNRIKKVLKNLVINEKAMQENLDKSLGLYNSQRVMLELTKKGLKREEAYKIVQNIAMDCWKKKFSFESELFKNIEIKKYLLPNSLKKILDLNYHFRNIDKIYKKVFKK